jgi:hypothetical protein
MTVTRRTPEDLLIAQQEAAARPRQPQRDYAWPASALYDPTFVRTPPGSRLPMRAPRTHIRVAQKRWPNSRKEGAMPTATVTAKSAKVVIVVDAQTVMNISCPEGGSARTLLTVKLPDRTVRADLASKSIRRVQALIDEHGVDGVACVLQGRLVAGGGGDQLVDVGISGEVKQPKAEPVVAPAATAA